MTLGPVRLANADAPPPPPAPPPPEMPARISPAPTLTVDLTPGPPAKPKDAIEPIKIKLIPPEASSPPAPPKKTDDDVDYTTNRYEPAGLPLLGGNSDIGFQFGVVGTLSHFANGIEPYAWNMDLVLSTSIKDSPSGAPQFVQESFLYNGDFVGFWGGKLRLNPQVQYQRTINEGYFGLGNAASGDVPGNYTGPAGRYFEWLQSEFSAYVQPRYSLKAPWFLTGVAGYRYMAPYAYADSKLARDEEPRRLSDRARPSADEPLAARDRRHLRFARQ
jgi:hypothetical protein